jgi:hypothetical protein
MNHSDVFPPMTLRTGSTNNIRNSESSTWKLRKHRNVNSLMRLDFLLLMLLIKLSQAILISGAVRGVARFSESAPAA